MLVELQQACVIMDGGSWTDHVAMGEKPQHVLYHVKPCCSYVYILCREVESIADLLC